MTGTDILKNGQYYEIVAKNFDTVLIAGGDTATESDDRGADAQYYQPINPPLHDKWVRTAKPVVELRNVDGFGDWTEPNAPVNNQHTYSQVVRGKGGFLGARFVDSVTKDNAGVITLSANPVPVVSLTSSGVGKETNRVSAHFTVTRGSLNLSDQMRIYFKISGTAKFGSSLDYIFSSNLKYDTFVNLYFVDLPGGTSSDTITMTPNDDSFVEPPKESVQVSLAYPYNNFIHVKKRYAINPSQATRTVQIYDNDHTPDFQSSDDKYVVNISPYQAANTALPKATNGFYPAKATDLDIGDSLTYAIVQGDQAKFRIDSHTGTVYLKVPASQLPFQEYNLKIRVRDAKGHEDFGFVQVLKKPTVGVGGIVRAIEGESKFKIEFVRFTPAPAAKDLVINFQVDWGPNFQGPSPTVSFNEFTADNELKKLQKANNFSVVIPKGAVSASINVEPKQELGAPPEGNEVFRVTVLATQDYVQQYNWASQSFGGKKYEGKARMDFTILEGMDVFVKGASGKPTDDIGLAMSNKGVHYNDINQGAVSNCNLMATLASVSMIDYRLIQNIISNADANGDYTVSLTGRTVKISTAELLEGYEELSGDIAPNGNAEIWTAILEKALKKSGVDCTDVAAMCAALGLPQALAYSKQLSTITAADIQAISNNLNANPHIPVMLGTMDDELVEGHPKTTFPADHNTYTYPVYDSSGARARLSFDHMYVVLGTVPASKINLPGTDRYLELFNPHGIGNEKYLKLNQQTLDYFFDEIYVFK